jgi:hypothetical protein
MLFRLVHIHIIIFIIIIIIIIYLFFEDGYDYFYRVNDDSAFEGKWASVLIPRLQETNNFGVVGTYDKQNPRIFTHSLGKKKQFFFVFLSFLLFFLSWKTSY